MLERFEPLQNIKIFFSIIKKWFCYSSRLCLTVSFTVLSSVASLTCNSRFYCKTSEIKYMAMNKLERAYLNMTAVSNHTVENITACQILCNREPRCFSLNVNISIAKQYECQILEQNVFMHADRVVVNSDFIHLYIEVRNLLSVWSFSFVSSLLVR